jgi:uncharacterized alpha-E superfamily protein
MLSRVATSLYLVGRHLENADHLARLLVAHSDLALDRMEADEPTFWTGALRLAGRAPGEVVSRRLAVELLVSGSPGPSIRQSIEVARAAAQVVRPSLSTEVFEQVNALRWRLAEPDQRAGLHVQLMSVQLGVHLIHGLIDDSMTHDEPRDFLRLGRFLARAGNSTRLVTQKLLELGGRHTDPADWSSVMKCGWSLEAYRWREAVPVGPDQLIRFLLFDGRLPYSVSFAVKEAVQSVRRIDGPRRRSAPRRLLLGFGTTLERTDPARVAAEPASFARNVRARLEAVEGALRSTYFLPLRLTRSMEEVGAATSSQPQQ